MIQLCLISRDSATIEGLPRLLGSETSQITVCGEPEVAMQLLARRHFDGLFVDFDEIRRAPAILEAMRGTENHQSTICCALSSDPTRAPAAFGVGATLVIDKPIAGDLSRRTLQLARQLMLREQRRYCRQSACFPVTAITDTQEIEATVINISEGGICLWSPQPLVLGSEVRLRFALPLSDGVHRVRATVVWSEPSGRAGLKFCSLPRAKRLVLNEWLAQEFLKQVSPAVSHRPQLESAVAANWAT